jgi:cytochrome c biogenesis protein CcmG, thiol:disulfide interchange protein DsbE
MKMQKLFTVLCLMCFAITLAAQSGKSLPQVEVRTFDGQKGDISEFIADDKMTIVSFWATWCKPCIQELDAIAYLYEDWQAEFDVELVAISIDDSRSANKAKGLSASKQWPYQLLSDPNNDCLRAFGFQAPPQTYLVDTEGNILYSHSGYTAGAEYELEDKLKALSEE